ncbi:MAG: hypothetical protein KGD64_00115 [Candidatus Heimdallarchaeota archaeon]|nr:hypothetical protein [Candidatus Heimdallarchaeota archaeon]
MENNRIVIKNDKESSLISSLLEGASEVSDFRLAINQFSKTKVTNLFRDSFSKFSSGVKAKITVTFNRYFFNDTKIDINEFWRFVNFRNFWAELRKFHDIVYSRDMSLNEVLKYFDRTLNSTKSRLNLNFLEKKIIEKLGKTPSALYKQIADDLDISEKKVSVTLQELNLRGIYLGSLISYNSLNLYEFFSFNRVDDFGENVVLIDKFVLFPNLRITHGILPIKKHGPSFYYVKDKKVFFNYNVLNQGLSIQDWKKHSSFSKRKKLVVQTKNPTSGSISSDKYPYITQLLRNCELDFKRPNVRDIAGSYDVSSRTLFRVKSKLIEEQIIQPNLMVENTDMLQIFIVSKSELVELYNKVPFISSYQISDDFGEISWLSYLSLFIPDFKYLYSQFNRRTEIFQVIDRQITDLNIDTNSTEFLHANHKIYTK